MLPIEDELDRLFRLPLDEFVSARNALAAALKKGGNAQSAKRVKALPKPAPSAWAVNQLYWHARPALDRLVASGDAYREAQKRALSGRGTDSLVEADRIRAEAIDEALGHIRTALEAGRLTPTPALWQRVRANLDALASFGSSNPEPVTGRLTSDPAPPGFGALAPLAPAVPVTAREPARARDERKIRAEIEAARQRLAEEERALAEAEFALERARAEVAERQERLEQARHRVKALVEESESGEAVEERD